MISSVLVDLQPGDGYRYRTVVGLLDEDESVEQGGNIYFSFGLGHATSHSYVFNYESWPSLDYFVEKLDLDKAMPRMSQLIGYLACSVALGVGEHAIDWGRLQLRGWDLTMFNTVLNNLHRWKDPYNIAISPVTVALARSQQKKEKHYD
jgi:hypothetical protein